MLKIVEQSLLYDFYGELLTTRQKEIYEEVILNDISFSEIATEKGISRQSVHDLVRRCDKILSEYEEKLHLVERFLKTKQDVLEICELTTRFRNTSDITLIDRISDISNRILEEI